VKSKHGLFLSYVKLKIFTIKNISIGQVPYGFFKEARPLRVFKEARPDFGRFGTECGAKTIFAVIKLPCYKF
jgi:hypothetical protein